MLFTRLLLTLLILGIDLAPILTKLSGRISLHDTRSYYADFAATDKERHDAITAQYKNQEQARTDRQVHDIEMSDSLFEARRDSSVARSRIDAEGKVSRYKIGLDAHLGMLWHYCRYTSGKPRPWPQGPRRDPFEAETGRRRSPTGAGRAIRRRRTVPARQPVASRLHRSRSWTPHRPPPPRPERDPFAPPSPPGHPGQPAWTPVLPLRAADPLLAADVRSDRRSRRDTSQHSERRRRWISTVRGVGCWGAAGFCMACSPPTGAAGGMCTWPGTCRTRTRGPGTWSRPCRAVTWTSFTTTFIQQLGLRHEERAAGVISEHVGEILDYGDDRGFCYLAYPLYEPGSLSKYCAQHPEGRTLSWCAQIIYEVLSGLMAAAGENLVHLDIKPGNIVLDGDQARVIDWGLSRRFDASKPSTWVARGTPFYACPEQMSGIRAGLGYAPGRPVRRGGDLFLAADRRGSTAVRGGSGARPMGLPQPHPGGNTAAAGARPGAGNTQCPWPAD